MRRTSLFAFLLLFLSAICSGIFAAPSTGNGANPAGAIGNGGVITALGNAYTVSATSTPSFAPGTAIAQWNDKSGIGNNVAQATNANQATTGTLNGVPALTFGGNASYGKAAATGLPIGTAALTYFSVASVASYANSPLVLGWGASTASYSVFYIPSNQGNAWGTQAFSVYSATQIDTAPHVLDWTYAAGGNGNTAVQLLDGNAQTMGNFQGGNNPNGTGAQLIVGKFFDGTLALNGTIGEELVFAGALSQADRQSIEGYLAWKWHLQANLPGGHPYKNAAPVGFVPTSVTGLKLWLDGADQTTMTAYQAPAMTPARAADFQNSMGANLHIETGGVYSNITTLRAMVAQTGLKHFRDTLTTAVNQTATLQNLHTLYGALFDMLYDPGYSTSAAMQTAINTLGVANVDAMEGPNECDISGQPGCGGANNYAATEAAAQTQVALAARALSAGIKIYGPSNTSTTAYTNVGSLTTNLDYGTTHNYTSWRNPETPGWGGTDACGVFGALTWSICWAQTEGPGKAVAATENGWGDYFTLDAQNNGGDSEGLVPPSVKADYVARDFTTAWENGSVARTYYFELADGPSSPGFSAHGLYDVNGIPKPSAVEIANLNAIVNDPGVTASSFTVTDTIGVHLALPAGAHAFLLQESDGSYRLVYWQACEQYQGDNHVPETCPTVTGNAFFTTPPAVMRNWLLNRTGGGEAYASTFPPNSTNIILTYKPQVQVLQLGGPVNEIPTATAAPSVATPTPSPAPPTAPPSTAPGNGSGVVTIPQGPSFGWGGNAGNPAYHSIFASNVADNNFLLALFAASPVGTPILEPIGQWRLWDSPTFSLMQSGAGGLNATVGANKTTGYMYSFQVATGGFKDLFIDESGGDWSSTVVYELHNVDPASPLATETITNNGNSAIATCPSIIVPRTGSLVITSIGTPSGAVSGLLTADPSGITAGFAFDQIVHAALPDFQTTFTFHTTTTTTQQNQSVGPMSATIASSAVPWFCHTVIVQPPPQ